MIRSSPGVRRTIAVLNFFADHPNESFTLSELVRALKLSRATCHGLLAGLVEAGYLYRTHDRSYLLGPVLISIGEVAKAHYSPLKAVQPEMRILADDFDVMCSAAFREGRDVVIRERATAVSHLGFSVPRGARLPLVPQFAGAFFVWSSPADVSAWLDDLDPKPSDSQRGALNESIVLIRRYGFFSHQRGPTFAEHSTKWLFDSAFENAPLLPILDINEVAKYELASVLAPVFDAARSVAFVISVHGFKGRHTASQLLSVGRRVREACDRITSFTSRR